MLQRLSCVLPLSRFTLGMPKSIAFVQLLVVGKTVNSFWLHFLPFNPQTLRTTVSSGKFAF